MPRPKLDQTFHNTRGAHNRHGWLAVGTAICLLTIIDAERRLVCANCDHLLGALFLGVGAGVGISGATCRALSLKLIQRWLMPPATQTILPSGRTTTREMAAWPFRLKINLLVGLLAVGRFVKCPMHHT